MSSLSMTNQQSAVNNLQKERKSIEVVNKTSMLNNLIYKPIDSSTAQASKAQTHHSISPQNRLSESFN